MSQSIWRDIASKGTIDLDRREHMCQSMVRTFSSAVSKQLVYFEMGAKIIENHVLIRPTFVLWRVNYEWLPPVF